MKITNWLIHKLGGYTKTDYLNKKVPITKTTVPVLHFAAEHVFLYDPFDDLQVIEEEAKQQLLKKLAFQLNKSNCVHFEKEQLSNIIPDNTIQNVCLRASICVIPSNKEI